MKSARSFSIGVLLLFTSCKKNDHSGPANPHTPSNTFRIDTTVFADPVVQFSGGYLTLTDSSIVPAAPAVSNTAPPANISIDLGQ